MRYFATVAGARRLFPVLALLIALSIVPVVGHPTFVIAQDQEDQDEIEQGREANRQIEAQYGFYEDEELRAYVDRIGQQLASISERPQLPWTFRVLDSPAVNAFALPGGFVYVTRGLLAHMNSEAELAGVLGHEIGHITGKHSQQRQRRGLIGSLITLGAIAGTALVSPDAAGFLLDTGLAQNVAGLVLLKYSRAQELDADQRGIRYATAGGYDPRGIGAFFETLQSLEERSDRRGLPGWLSTHPQVDDRIGKSAVWTAETLRVYNVDPEDLTQGREDHFFAVDGIVFGENPREGYLDGQEFLHPDLRFALTFPSGWSVDNGRSAVTAVDPRQGAMIQLTLAPKSNATATDDYIRGYLRDVGARVEDSARQEIDGLEAVQVLFSARGARGNYAILGLWVSYEGRLYQLLGVTTPSAWRHYRSELSTSLGSFRRVTEAPVLGVEPARVKVSWTTQRLQLAGFIEAHPEVSVPAATIAIINHLELSDMLEAGALVKLVAGGPR